MRRRSWMAGASALAGVASTGLTSALARAGDRITGRREATRSEVIAREGMAATSQPLATLAALDILRAGGTAVDAAIAANAVLGVVEPVGCGIGGDLFAIVWEQSSGRLYGLNGSGRSPAALDLKTLRERLAKEKLEAIPAHGPLPVSVPGCVDGWFALHGRFGRKTMREILAPAIGYAKDGFPVSELIAHYWKLNAASLSRFESFKQTFMPGGKTPQKGEVFKNPGLAGTYGRLAADGPGPFYRGDLAEAIAAHVQAQGGYLSREDLAAHGSTWVKPVRFNYRGYDLWELPPNGQGIAAQQILGILEGFDLRAMGFGSVAYLHHLIEAKKIAFEDRAKFYADPAFNEIPVGGLISEAYLAERRKLIGKKAAKRIEAGNPALERGDTTYLCTADAEGNMVSLIQSNYRGMGSGMVPPGLGFGLQDRGQLFALEDGHFNVYAPSKRPFHTIIPAFVTREGKALMSFGVMGGAAQPQMHAQVMVNLIDFDMGLQEAGDAARMLHLGSSQPTGEEMLDGGTVYLESAIGADVRRALARRGHRIEDRVGGYGGYQAVWRNHEHGVWIGASESRKDGLALGW